MKLVENVSRRSFLKGTLASGVFILTARYVPKQLCAAEGKDTENFSPGVWMSIAADGTVTIVAHRSEMGCGSRTALPLVVADELDADWSKIKLEQAIGNLLRKRRIADHDRHNRMLTWANCKPVLSQSFPEKLGAILQTIAQLG